MEGKTLGGFTDNYLRIQVDLGQDFDNTVAPLRLDSLLPDGETIKATPIA